MKYWSIAILHEFIKHSEGTEEPYFHSWYFSIELTQCLLRNPLATVKGQTMSFYDVVDLYWCSKQSSKTLRSMTRL